MTDITYELQKMRAELIKMIDSSFEQLIRRMEAEQEQNVQNVAAPYEVVYSLMNGGGFFKGKKPVGVIFSEDKKESVTTWKKVVAAILKECNDMPEFHNKLMELRGKASGRERNYLARTPEGMRSPLEIDKYLFVETHYDTESLLRILTTRILDAIGYDYSGIHIAIRNDC